MAFVNTKTERRRFKRIILDAPVRYKFKNSNEFGSTLSRDISVGGIRLGVEKFVPVNTDVVLELSLDKLAKVVSIGARVVWASMIAYSERYQLGLEFYETNSPSLKDIGDYVNSRQS